MRYVFFFSALLGCFCFQGGWTMELNLYVLLRCTILTMITSLTAVHSCQPGSYGTGSYTVCLGLCLMLIRFCSFVVPCLLSSSVLLNFWFIVWFIIQFLVCHFYLLLLFIFFIIIIINFIIFIIVIIIYGLWFGSLVNIFNDYF